MTEKEITLPNLVQHSKNKSSDSRNGSTRVGADAKDVLLLIETDLAKNAMLFNNLPKLPKITVVVRGETYVYTCPCIGGLIDIEDLDKCVPRLTHNNTNV
jgi:hypothetical protein